MICYLIRATLLALCLASPVLPAAYMAWDQGLHLDEAEQFDCMTDMECQNLYGGDGYAE